MKQNRKNKKLKFIREKNDLRLGKNSITITKKVSNSIDVISYASYLIDEAKKIVFKKYNLNIRNSSFNYALDNDDFIKDLITIKIVLNN